MRKGHSAFFIGAIELTFRTEDNPVLQVRIVMVVSGVPADAAPVPPAGWGIAAISSPAPQLDWESSGGFLKQTHSWPGRASGPARGLVPGHRVTVVGGFSIRERARKRGAGTARDRRREEECQRGPGEGDQECRVEGPHRG